MKIIAVLEDPAEPCRKLGADDGLAGPPIRPSRR